MKNVNEIAEIIGLPGKEWTGKCYGVASACIDKGIVQGKLRYGHYRGPIAKGSMFSNMIGLGFCNHGWVELPNGDVYDPTRWVFECKEPYIYIGKNDHYDVGGNIGREKFRSPAPAFDKSKKTFNFNITQQALNIVKSHLNDYRDGDTFTIEQIHWISGIAPKKLGDSVKEIYNALASMGNQAFIPLDNWRLVME